MDYFFASALSALLGVSIFGLVSAIADEAARQGCIDGSRVEHAVFDSRHHVFW